MEDIFGLKVWGEAAKLVLETGLDGTKVFLNSLAKPGLEELGYRFKDRISERRLLNVIRTLEKNKGNLIFEDGELKISPKILGDIMENASNEDDDDMQKLWAGLLTSSSNDLTIDNSIYVDILKKMSPLGVKLLNYGCTFSKKTVERSTGVVYGWKMIYETNLLELFGTDDIDRLWTELEYLASIGLQFIPTTFDGGGITKHRDRITIYPTDLAIELFIRCQGSSLTPKEFFKNEILSDEEFQSHHKRY